MARFVRQAVGSLFDREVELAQIEAALAGAGSGVAGFAYVEGAAGIGKTRLVEAACSRVARRGVRVLSATGGELERDFSYGVVRGLFEAAVLEAGGARSELLAGPAALAAVAVGLESERGAAAAPDSPFPVVHALYWLTANAAAHEPLLVVVDDAQWADPPSLRFLDYLAGRLEGLPVAILVAARPAEPGLSPELLASLRDRRAGALVRPRPLAVEATGAVLRERFGAEPDRAFVAACQRASAGNPLYLHELIDALRADRIEPDASAAGLVAELGPDTVARSLMLRLGRLPTETVAVAEAAAVLGAGAEVRRVAALTRLSVDAVGDAADLLADADVLGPTRPLGFVHPVVRHAIYGQLRPAVRARLHARAAAALIGEGCPASDVAVHQLAGEPVGDERAVAVLREAAATAVRQGAGDLAARYLRRALAEPPAGEALADVLAELGQAEVLAGQELEQASRHLEDSAERTSDPAERAARVEVAARTRLYRGDLEGAVELLERELGRLGAGDADTALRLRAHQAAIGVLAPALARSAVERLDRFTGLAGDTPAELAALAELAGSRWLDGWIEAAAELAERALAGGHLLAAEGPVSVPFNHAVAVLIDADRYERALPALEACMSLAREQGSLLGIAGMISLRAVANWRRGAIADTDADARAVLGLLEHSPTPMHDPAQWSYLTLALTERGELAEAEAAIARSGTGPELPALSYMGIAFFARARLRLAQGRPGEALADLLELAARDERLGVRHLRIPWHREAVQACLAVGDRDRAVRFAEQQSERAQRWDTASARGLALSTRGLASTGREQIELLADGAALLGASPARLDHARALLDLGAALRRHGRRAEARQTLSEALDAARACGAGALTARAHQELIAAGARPRRLRLSGAHSLTAGERRVAQLAAQGLSNREIAATLFITVRTVENHLARSYRKLDIRSRAQLRAALDAQAAPE